VLGPDAELIAVLADAQRLGFLGSRPVDEVVEHARSFVDAIDDCRGRLLDVGSGGGVPGLVVARSRPDLEVVLLDRREKRTDVLERAVRKLGLSERVAVVCADADSVASSSFDVVTARGFGPPERTLRLGVRLARAGGVVVISEPPGGDRWEPQLLDDLGVRRTVVGSVARFDGFT
jgi:16S rRNA (guanine527-N7)-methyltransferase